MRRLILLLVLILLLLTSCWSSQELDDTALVQGVGMNVNSKDNLVHISVEIIKPTQHEGGENQGSGQHIVLEKESETLFDGARDLIRYAKRRLDFGHTKVWIMGQEIAQSGFIEYLDAIRRDQMLRLNSYLFVTKENPTDILNTATLYEHITAIELISALDQTQFVAEFTPIKIREFYKLIEGPVPNAYIPMISIQEVGDQTITVIGGTAVIQDNQFVGELNSQESMGLNWLLNRVEGGSIAISENKSEMISMEITSSNTKTKPRLNGTQLDVDIEIFVEGTLSDNMTPFTADEEFFNRIEKDVSKQVETDVRSTLDKLQKELKTDITDIGIITHRKFPKQWPDISEQWNEIFANATVNIHVTSKFTHEGLLKQNVHTNHKKPNNNHPFKFWK